jgi:uncharacterized protein (TIGR02271 family)
MSNTITAIYRTADIAEMVASKIAELGVSRRHVTTIGGADRTDHVDSLHLPHDEARTYKQAISEGHHVVSAEVDDAHIDAAAEIMRHPEQGVDIDAYEEEYRATPGYAAEGETAIPVGEERLTVGKRAVGRGTAHVRTYVQEVPVEERVRLREERISLDRRDANEAVTGAEAEKLFQEREVEVTTQSEEAVVGKEAVVTGEVVVGKEVTEREEVVRDTVRKTEVDVDRDGK